MLARVVYGGSRGDGGGIGQRTENGPGRARLRSPADELAIVRPGATEEARPLAVREVHLAVDVEEAAADLAARRLSRHDLRGGGLSDKASMRLRGSIRSSHVTATESLRRKCGVHRSCNIEPSSERAPAEAG